MAKRINHNNLLPWFTDDHGTLPKAYLKSCKKFFEELGIKTKTNELQAASFKRQATSDKLQATSCHIPKQKKIFKSYL
jgi:hypothetical protein